MIFNWKRDNAERKPSDAIESKLLSFKNFYGLGPLAREKRARAGMEAARLNSRELKTPPALEAAEMERAESTTWTVVAAGPSGLRGL